MVSVYVHPLVFVLEYQKQETENGKRKSFHFRFLISHNINNNAKSIIEIIELRKKMRYV